MTKLFKSIANWWRSKSDQLSETIGDPVLDERYFIEDRKNDIRNFTKDLIGLQTHNKVTQESLRDAEADFAKFDNFAKSIAAKIKSGDTSKNWNDLLAKAAGEVDKCNNRITNLKKQLQMSEAEFAKLNRIREQATSEIEKREQDMASSTARIKSATMIKEMKKNSLGLSDDGVRPLEEVARQAEAEAGAYEEMSSTVDDELEAAVGKSSDVAVSELVTSYLK